MINGAIFIYVPYTGQPNDAGMLAWNREADDFLQMIMDQFDTLYREGAENGRVMCLSLPPHNIGRPNAAKYLDEALRYILGHDGVWNTTADDIARLLHRQLLRPGVILGRRTQSPAVSACDPQCLDKDGRLVTVHCPRGTPVPRRSGGIAMDKPPP